MQRAVCELSILKNSFHFYEQMINPFYIDTYLMHVAQLIEFLLQLYDVSTIIIPICTFIQMRKLKLKLMSN